MFRACPVKFLHGLVHFLHEFVSDPLPVPRSIALASRNLWKEGLNQKINTRRLNELTRGKRRGIDRPLIIFSKIITPECYYWGSSQSFAWIPAKSMRE